jgi:septal ring factor EnvC (AmiA/AmiB activator)
VTTLEELERDVAHLEERQRELEVANRDLEHRIRELRTRHAWATQQLVELARRLVV